MVTAGATSIKLWLKSMGDVRETTDTFYTVYADYQSVAVWLYDNVHWLEMPIAVCLWPFPNYAMLTQFTRLFVQYERFVAPCSADSVPSLPHTSVSGETPCLPKCVSACLCWCQFSHCVFVCTVIALQSSEAYWVLIWSWCTCEPHTQDEHTRVLMDPEQQ